VVGPSSSAGQLPRRKGWSRRVGYRRHRNA
jgi:hypothetical protein